MYKYAQPNPSGRSTDDCLVRTLSIIMDIPWEQAYADLCNYGMMIHDMPNKDTTLTLYLKTKGYRRYMLPTDCPACFTIREFANDHPVGKYIILTSNHAVPVINGDYYDVTDSGNEIISYYWTKERE